MDTPVLEVMNLTRLATIPPYRLLREFKSSYMHIFQGIKTSTRDAPARYDGVAIAIHIPKCPLLWINDSRRICLGFSLLIGKLRYRLVSFRVGICVTH